MTKLGVLCAAAFVATVWLANELVNRYGVVPVGFGLVAPAGVYVVGVAFTLRDLVDRLLGRAAVVAAIVAGSLLSLLISPSLAVASASAFVVSELADLAVYAPLERRGWTRAVAASNVVGAMVDSTVFLWLAFHSLAFWQGQVVGKLWMTALAVTVIVATRAAGRRHQAA